LFAKGVKSKKNDLFRGENRKIRQKRGEEVTPRTEDREKNRGARSSHLGQDRLIIGFWKERGGGFTSIGEKRERREEGKDGLSGRKSSQASASSRAEQGDNKERNGAHVIYF